MHKLRILLVSSALLMAACGGGAVLSSTNDKPASLAGSFQINGGANAGSDLRNSDVNQVNAPVEKGGAGPAQPLSRTQPQAVTPAAAPSGAVIVDRCSTGSGTIGNGPTPLGGKEPPQLMCASQ